MTANHTRKHPIIIFDLGGVLLDWDPGRAFLDACAAALPIPRARWPALRPMDTR